MTPTPSSPPPSDIKAMIPRSWEPALLRAQGAAGVMSMTAFVKKIVKERLVSDGFLTEAGQPTLPPANAC